MADASDVSNVLAGICANVIYPNGIAEPAIVPSPVKVYVGWPDKATLDHDLRALNQGPPNGAVHVSIYPRPTETVTTKYRATQTVPQTYNPPTISATVAGQTITLQGVVTSPQNVALMVAGLPYTYAVQSGDTLASVATGLALQIPGATSAGAVITAPNGATIGRVRAGGAGTTMQLVRRQRKEWQVTVWANSDATRNALGAPLDNAFAQIRFIGLPDTTSGRLLYVSNAYGDAQSQAQLFRRDFIYSVEFDTTIVYPAADVVVTQLSVALGITGQTESLTTLPPIYAV